MKTERLGNIAEFINGVAFKPEDWHSEGKKIIRIQNLTDPSKPYNLTNRLVDDKYIVKRGDVLVSWSATIDVFIWNDDDALVNQHIFKVVFDNSKVIKTYFIFALKRTIAELSKLAHGSTMKHVVKKDFDNHKIPLPSLEDQIRIATVLSKAEALIAQRKESIRLLDEFLKSTFLGMFGDPVRNEKAFEVKPLENLVHPDCPLTYGIVQPGQDFPNGVPVIRPVDMIASHITKKGLKLIDPKISQKFKRTILKGNEILMCVRGTTGVVSYATEELSGCNVTRGITPIWFDDGYQKLFAFFLFQTSAMQRQISYYTYGATLQQINLSDLRKLKLIVPSLDLQKRFVEIAEICQNIKTRFLESENELGNLFNSLSQSAFKDELNLDNVSIEDTSQEIINQQVSIKPISEYLQEKLKPLNLEPLKPLSELLKEELSKEEKQSYRQFEEPAISAELLANEITERFKGYHFNFEMLATYLNSKGLKYHPYRSSEEIRMTKALDETEDLKYFIHSAITNASRDELEQNTKSYLQIEQYFYNGLTENFVLKLHVEDYELIKNRSKEKRSGIYFSITE